MLNNKEEDFDLLGSNALGTHPKIFTMDRFSTLDPKDLSIAYDIRSWLIPNLPPNRKTLLLALVENASHAADWFGKGVLSRLFYPQNTDRFKSVVLPPGMGGSCPDFMKLSAYFSEFAPDQALCVRGILAEKPEVLCREIRVSSHQNGKDYGLWALISEALIRVNPMTHIIYMDVPLTFLTKRGSMVPSNLTAEMEAAGQILALAINGALMPKADLGAICYAL